MNHLKKHHRLASLLTLSIAAGAVWLLVVSGALAAAGSQSIITLPWQDPAKKPIPPSFILPEQARWGCLSCHSNPRLSKFRNGKEVSLTVDPKIIGNSMHKKIACLDCHTNFSYDSHPTTTPGNYRKVAGNACMKCHPYQAYLYKNSTHGKLALQNKLGHLNGKSAEPPLCSSCHGFHDIQSPRFEPYRTEFRQSIRSGGVCVQCHRDRYESYSDYYHGKGLKAGAKDAPVCWDCHSNHNILPAKDSRSTVNESKLPGTCDKCHDQPTSSFTSYAPMIHGRGKLFSDNFVVRVIGVLIPGVGAQNTAVERPDAPQARPAVGQQQEGLLARVWHWFFPGSLRPEDERR